MVPADCFAPSVDPTLAIFGHACLAYRARPVKQDLIWSASPVFSTPDKIGDNPPNGLTCENTVSHTRLIFAALGGFDSQVDASSIGSSGEKTGRSSGRAG